MTLLNKKKKKQRKTRRPLSGAASIRTDAGYGKFRQNFHMEVSNKEIVKTIKDYVRKEFKDPKRKAILKNEDWRFVHSNVAAYCYWSLIEDVQSVPEETIKWMDKFFHDLAERGMQLIEEKKDIKPQGYKPTIQERMKDQLRDIIGELDTWLDNPSKYLQPKIFDYLKSKNVAHAHVSKIHCYYQPIYEEIRLLNSADCPRDLKEGYSQLSKTEIKRLLRWFNTLFSDLEAYKNMKKATRKTRTKRVKSADKLVNKMKYKKEDTEYKIASINPINIIDAATVYTFNTKYRTLSVYVGKLSVKGTTLQNFDLDESYTIKIRKPEEVLPAIINGTPRKINKLLNSLKVKRQTAKGRINNNVVLLKAY